MPNLLARALLARGERDPHRPALTGPDGATLTYGELLAGSARYASALRARGADVGDRVVVQAPNGPGLVLAHLGAVRAGIVWVPANPAYTDAEVARMAADCGARFAVRGDAELAALASHAAGAEAPDADRTAGDPAALLYTSGTTGAPKGAVLSHGNLAQSIAALHEAWAIGEDDVLLHALPLFHVHGLFVALHPMLAAGASILLLPAFDADAVIRQLPAATVYMGVPTHYARLLADGRFTAAAAPRARLLTSGSAPMSEAMHARLRERLGTTVLERYGMTETSMLATNPLHGERRPGTVGLPMPGVELRLAASPEGEVEVRGPSVFAGYWGREAERASWFTADGWFRTGDIGRFDEAGYLVLCGRAKELIITGGLNVHPGEVEAAFHAAPGIVECAAFGLPDDEWGEAVTLAVVPAPGAVFDDEAAAALRERARGSLAAFKLPKRVVVVDALPRNAMGKVQRAELTRRFSAGR